VLDVGAGRGDGLELIEKAGAKCCIGIDPLPMHRNIVKMTLAKYHNTSGYKPDICLAMDVIEHIEHPKAFIFQMMMTARELIFLTTPNYNVHKCKNQFHIREYTPLELTTLFEHLGIYDKCKFFEADEKRNITEVKEIQDDSMAHDFGVLITL
jgi:hypothetical protein